MQAFFETGDVLLDDGKRHEKKPPKPDEPQAMQCPACFGVHDAAPVCPACGHEYPKRKSTVTHVPGSLKELVATRDRRVMTAGLWPQIVGLAHERGKAAGWALAQFRSITGSWPIGDFEDTLPAPVSAEVRGKVKSLQIAYVRSNQRQSSQEGQSWTS
jgi:hypothetical protein